MTETHIDAQDGHTMCGQQRSGNGVPAEKATHQACQDVAKATDEMRRRNRDS